MSILLSLVAFVAVMSPHQTTEQFLLRLHPKRGAVSRLHIEGHVERFDQPGAADFDSIFKVTSLEQVPKGHLFHWVVEKADFKGTGSMKAASAGSQMAGREMDVVEDGRGRIVNAEIEGFLDSQLPTSSVILPKEPVKVGDTWTDSLGRGGAYKASFKFDRVVEEAGAREAVITASFPDMPGIQPASPLTYWIDIKTGQLVKATGDMDMHQGSAHISFHFKLSLL